MLFRSESHCRSVGWISVKLPDELQRVSVDDLHLFAQTIHLEPKCLPFRYWWKLVVDDLVELLRRLERKPELLCNLVEWKSSVW